MNDEFKGKSGKVKVMYVRGEDEQSARAPNPRTGKGGRPAARREDTRRSSGPRTERSEEGGRSTGRRSDSAPRRNDSAPRRNDRSSDNRDAYGSSDSPWRTVSRAPVDEPKSDNPGISGKGVVDVEQIRRQRLEETRVYGENACQALFQSRPESIVRAWFVQSVTPRFATRCAGWQRTVKPTTW